MAACLAYVGLCLTVMGLLAGCGDRPASPIGLSMQKVGPGFQLRLLTYNILSAADLKAIGQGYLAWPLRHMRLASWLRAQSFDLFAAQEATPDQLVDLRANLPAFGLVTVNSTSDAALFYRHDRFSVATYGHWALPSSGLLNMPRIALWVKLNERRSGRDLLVISTHFDAQRKTKLKTARYLQQELAQLDPELTTILMGDFNLSPEQVGYELLEDTTLVDAFHGDEGHLTFPAKVPERRIDHIFYGGSGITVLDRQVRHPGEAALMSDHLPVTATLDIAAFTDQNKIE